MSRPRILAFLALLAAISCFRPGEIRACDMCAIYSAVQLRDSTLGLYLGVAEQFSHFGTLQRAGHEVANPGNERLESSISQLVLGYAPLEEVALQLNLPIIARHFRRSTEDGSERDDVSGVGDLTFLMRYRALSFESMEGGIRLSALAGVELPTGPSGRLGEEREDEASEVKGRPRHGDHEHEVASGIHGHDLALGSGSVDALFGGDLVLFWKRLYLSGSTQYRLRNRGSFDYEYADEWTANLGPGFFLFAEHGRTLAFSAAVSMETKGKDRSGGRVENDTAMTAIYAGPGLQLTWHPGLSVELSGELPALRNNSGLQIVPDYRLRAALLWHF